MSNNLTSQTIKISLEKLLIKYNLLLDVFIKDEAIDVVIEFSKEKAVDQSVIQVQIESILKRDYPNFKNIRVIFSSQKDQKPEKIKHKVPNVKKIILMASAKGGVGKSTTAVNIAMALANQGFSIGIVDADIYGPTLPKLLGIKQKPETEDGKMLPIKKHNIHSISIGYIVDESQAAIWRGPMVSKALYQLLLGVKWPEIDYLIIDMPPGTGDIYLSLAENFIVDGVVLITTPQNIALTMIKKSTSFFNKTNIPIVGIIENMSYFLDEKNNTKHYIFGPSLIEDIAECKLLGSIPLITKISDFSDRGESLINEQDFAIYQQVAKRIINCIT